MKTIKAFLTALVLCMLSIGVLHVVVNSGFPEEGIHYATWIDESKGNCTTALTALLKNPDSLMIYGSSELRHGVGSGFHADTIFENTDMQPVFIGSAGHQSLNHAITLGAVADKTADKKAVLIVSPQWFKQKGVSENAFEATFSEDNFIHMLKNQNISRETKDYIIERTRNIVRDNENMSRKIENDVKWYDTEDGTFLDIAAGRINEMLIQEKTSYSLYINAHIDGVWSSRQEGVKEPVHPQTWEKLALDAQKIGEEISSNNAYGMYDKAYEKEYRKLIKYKKHKHPKYSLDSAEFEDLECFLKICKEEEITPLVVILPFNGYWYDYSELPSEERSGFYEKVRTIAQSYHAECADLSENEYAKYYFEDNSHPALKGLVDLNEKIYEFYTENETE